MGRRARGILEYAKTITWYDYLFNEAKKLKEIKIINEYQFYKFMYSNSIYSPEAKLFRKYKFGLSTPQKAWKKSTEELIPSAIDIIEHPIWNIENLEFNSDKVISEMHNLTLGIREDVISEGVYTPQPVSYSILKKISAFHDLDAIYAIYLLYQWGLIINNYQLCNCCAETLEKNLEKFLLNISYLHRSHIFLFDIIFNKIKKVNYKDLTIAEVTNINWRKLRGTDWKSNIRMNSYVSEYKLSKNAVISEKLKKKEIYISYSDSLILKVKIATDPNDLIALNFNDFFPSHIIFSIQKNITENHN